MEKHYLLKKVWLEQSWQNDIYVVVNPEGIITKVENYLSEKPVEAKVDVLSGRILPGLINGHSHAFQRIFAGLTEFSSLQKSSFWTWRKMMYRCLELLSPDDVYTIAYYVYLEMLQAGYIEVAEFHYLHNDVSGHSYDKVTEIADSLVNAALDAGIKITLLPVLYRFSGFGEQNPQPEQRRFILSTDKYQQLIQELSTSYQEHPQISIGMAAHSLRAVNAEDLWFLEQLSFHHNNSPIHLHIAEQEAEVESCIEHHRQRPVEWLSNVVKLDRRWTLVHATHINNDEVTAMAKANLTVSLCPTTEANLGDGIFPLQEWLALKGQCSVGTDSQISISTQEELRWLEYGQRLQLQARNIVNSPFSHNGMALYEMARSGGKHSLQKSESFLTVGSSADWVVIDSDSMILDVSDKFWFDAWLFAVNPIPSSQVMINGKWVIKSDCGNSLNPQQQKFSTLRKRILASQ
ncbi:MAG: formimidoylglutamate deiminase [Pseudomonadota bacterium]